MNKVQVEDMEHALRNGNRFYAEADNKDWNELVDRGFASKHPGWENGMAYFRVTSEGEKALKLTDYQLGKLKHAFGLDYSKKPYRNYYHCNKNNDEWEDMCIKGYATKRIYKEDEIVYFGTLKGLREVFRRNVSQKYFEAINA
ncbi:hypothetical protein MXL46_11740 [Heyndrickxia sporothermodurans]|uniref:hypothetical protein n=1 Tax=Heyndrickxia sporothermodurans TaxID=46224 RepID=UPI002DBBC487|nr:hypothetical protein [Heyndrickxia sporothermodurans]MEB6549758.1 hypothetical protein [Heyndrickxia sporothermodurans]